MDYMTDLSAITGTQRDMYAGAKNSTNPNAGMSGLSTVDFLQLMVAQFQYQDIENTASTSDMLNQMVQMSVIQAVSEITTVINDATTLTYSASLVGKEVTVGQYENGKLVEISGIVTGTGSLGGRQVIFIGDKSYYLSDIMAVGKLPDKDDITPPGDGGDEDKDDLTPEHPIELPKPENPIE